MNHRFFLQILLSPAVKLPAVLVVLLAVSFVRICASILLLLLTTRKQKHFGKILIVIINMTTMSNNPIARPNSSTHYFIKNPESMGEMLLHQMPVTYIFDLSHLLTLRNTGIISLLRKSTAEA